jgi:hypothetical protein
MQQNDSSAQMRGPRVENERETFRLFSKKKEIESKKGKMKWHFVENERKRKNHKRKWK